MGTLGSFPGAHEHKGPCLSMYVVFGMFFSCLNTDFLGSTNTMNICLMLSTYSKYSCE